MRILIALFTASLALPALAQTPIQVVAPIKKIEVTGSAEREITPNEIWFSISLREYKDGSRKVDIDRLEKQLVEAVEAQRISRDNLRIDNVSAWQNYWERKRNTEFLASKRYLIKLSDLIAINPILDRLDPRGIESTFIQSYSHTDIEKMRQELKVQALQAARTKAGNLLGAIGEKLGPALEIYEQGDLVDSPQPRYANMMAKAEAVGGAPAEIDFKTIKLRAEIRAVFGIQ